MILCFFVDGVSGDGTVVGRTDQQRSRREISQPLQESAETSTKFMLDNTSHESGISLGISSSSSSSRGGVGGCYEADSDHSAAAAGRGINEDQLRYSTTGRAYRETHFPVEPSSQVERVILHINCEYTVQYMPFAYVILPVQWYNLIYNCLPK